MKEQKNIKFESVFYVEMFVRAKIRNLKTDGEIVKAETLENALNEILKVVYEEANNNGD